MAEVKLTKNALRAEQKLLKQLERYLPTLQLKKAMLQGEVRNATIEIEACQHEADERKHRVEGFAELLTETSGIDVRQVAVVKEVHRRYENIAGVEVPYFESVDFTPVEYSLFATPPWVDSAVDGIRALVAAICRVIVAREKREALQRELREVSIRVNLFEKILIPRAKKNIKKIRVFLGDQELAAVGQAKKAKEKIEKRKALAVVEASNAH